MKSSLHRGLAAWLLSRRAAGILWCALAFSPWAAAQTVAPVAMDEVPFITTPDHVTVAMLDLAGVSAADHVIDLGSGDGRIVITAARRFGATGLGVEIVPDLVARSIELAQRAGVQSRTRFLVQDLFGTDLAPASVVTMYLLPEVNMALRPRLLALAPGTRIVSHDWDLGDWLPDRTLTLDVPQKAIGREKRSRLFLWTVPAPVAGLWCGEGGATLRIEQKHQVLQADVTRGTERRGYSGRAHGRTLNLLGAGSDTWSAALQSNGTLVTTSAADAFTPARWTRASSEVCA